MENCYYDEGCCTDYRLQAVFAYYNTEPAKKILQAIILIKV